MANVNDLPRCKTCKCYQPKYLPDGKEDQGWGFCHRYAPRPEQGEWGWPAVDATDFCGEHVGESTFDKKTEEPSAFGENYRLLTKPNGKHIRMYENEYPGVELTQDGSQDQSDQQKSA